MRFTYQFPTNAISGYDSYMDGHALGEIAAAVEQAGFDAFAMTDHPFPPREWLDNGGHHSFDPFVSLSFAAAATTRLKLMTFALVAGYRNPYLAAKSVSSLDVLSGGRVIVGMAAGYNAQEFAVLGADFAHRGEAFDAALGAMRAAWSEEVVRRDDRWFPADGHTMLPRPVQRPNPPLWIGGNSDRALRRAAAQGDGWLPFAQGQRQAEVTRTSTLESTEELAARIARLGQLREDNARSGPFDVCFTPRGVRDLDARVDQFAASVEPLSAAGVTWLTVESRARSYGDCLTEIERFAPVLRG